MGRKRMAALMTCHNRREKTLVALSALFSQEVDCEIQVYLVDDGSTDGTTEAVRLLYHQVRIIAGSGDLYWNGGMRLAFTTAQQGGYDYYLWLNDDTILYPGAVRNLLDTYERLVARGYTRSIVVGSAQDPETGRHTYGGSVRSSGWHPMRFDPVLPDPADPRPCDCFNGNCVLIPKVVSEQVGNLDPRFTHSMGDTDYGLRAKKLACQSWIAPGYVGICSRNPIENTFGDPTLPLRERWSKLVHPKGLPPREWRTLTRRHAGPLWPLFWFAPYAKLLWEGLRRRLV